ncbi:ClbS/DfsB family four-helix bundle protein [bacterium]|nr:ClbS/DfsB family four-helix bundle protein [bacterium]
MPRPETKQELYDAIEKERGKLLKALDSLTDEQVTQPGACEAWSAKDILSHLTDWEQRVMAWVRAGRRGEVPAVPDEDYNWRQTPELNQAIYEKYRDLPLATVMDNFDASFAEMMAMIDGMTDEELFSPGVYEWTGNNLVRDYVNSCTAAHYRWASALLRKFARGLAEG